MALVTIRVVTPIGEYKFSQGRQHSLLRQIQTVLELELKRDFETGVCVLHERDDGTSEIVANVTGPRHGKPPTDDERKLLDQINEMLAPDYAIETNGDVVDKDGTPIPGLGVDWRGVGKLIEEKGKGVLPGFVESVIAGAKEIERKGGTSGRG